MSCAQSAAPVPGPAAKPAPAVVPALRGVAMALRALALIAALGLVVAVPAPARSDAAAVTDAADAADVLAEAMQLGALFEVMAAEGMAYGDKLAAEVFPGAGGADWRAEVTAIYAPDRQLALFRDAFDAALAAAGADSAAMEDFFVSDLGRRVVTLELSARRAFLDKAVEEASRLRYRDAIAADDPRLALVNDFVTINDLVEANVAGALNANYAFYQGLLDSGGLAGAGPSEEEIIAEVWGQEESIREETDIWVHSYLLLAYAPLSDEDLTRYLDFSRTGPGQLLNRALFAGFDRVFVDSSRRLGQAAGRQMSGSEL